MCTFLCLCDELVCHLLDPALLCIFNSPENRRIIANNVRHEETRIRKGESTDLDFLKESGEFLDKQQRRHAGQTEVWHGHKSTHLLGVCFQVHLVLTHYFCFETKFQPRSIINRLICPILFSFMASVFRTHYKSTKW